MAQSLVSIGVCYRAISRQKLFQNFRQDQIMMIHACYSGVESHDTRFIYMKVINCIDPQNCWINYLDPVLLEQTPPGDAKH